MDIRRRVATSLKWTASLRLIGQILSWLITLMVIRMLSPGDYGLMALATAFIGFLYLINTAGLDAALVQKEDLRDSDRSSVFGFLIFLNLGIFAVLVLTAPWIALFFEEPELELIVQVLALRFVIVMFETLPLAELEREINFKSMSVVDLTTIVLGSVTSLGMAVQGFGVWSLVIGHLVTNVSRVVGLNIVTRALIWPSFDFSQLKALISFGGLASVDRVLWFVFSESDKFVGGKILGKELLGVYAVADHLAALPLKKVGGLVSSIAFPAFSRVQTDLAIVGRYLEKAFRTSNMVSLPVFVGIAAVAPEAVAILLGDKWSDVAILLQVLALTMPLRMLGILLPPVLWGIGKPKISAVNYAIAAVIMVSAFVFGSQYGAYGLAMAWLLAYPLIFAVIIVNTCRAIGYSVWALVETLVRPAAAAGVMYAVVHFGRTICLDVAGPIGLLVQLSVLGGATYAMLTLMFNRRAALELYDLVRN